MTLVRLNKFLARAGVASRRKADDYIREGLIQVNGQVVTEMGTQVDPAKDHVRLEGKRIGISKAPPLYLLMHKPKNYMVTREDPEGRPTVFEILGNAYPGLFNVGRLDFDTEGLLLFTNDGELTYHLTHPRLAIPRIYWVKVKGRPEEKKLEKMRHGMRINGVLLKPARVEIKKEGESNSWIEMVLTEGRNRQVREMCAYVGHPVSKLKRVAFATLRLGNLPVGQVRRLTDEEIEALREYVQEREKRLTRKRNLSSAKIRKPRAKTPKHH